MEHAALLAELSPLTRLALSYAPKAEHKPTIALLALDARLGGVVRAAREPMLARIKLAWWRERLTAPLATWPVGEPLLAALTVWGELATGLAGLVDGWESLLFEPDPADLIEARANACAALAKVVGKPEAAQDAARAGRLWAQGELGGLADPEPGSLRLPRQLRPLAVLGGLGARQIAAHSQQSEPSPVLFLAAMRIGLFGR